MIANVGRVMARSANARNRCQSQHIINTGYIHNVDRLRIEDDLAPCNTGASRVRRTQPRVKQVEDSGVERSARWVEAETRGKRIVDADKKGLRSQRKGTTSGSCRVEPACPEINRLRRPQTGFEIHDVLDLLRRWRRGGLRMAIGGIDGLVSQVRSRSPGFVGYVIFCVPVCGE